MLTFTFYISHSKISRCGFPGQEEFFIIVEEERDGDHNMGRWWKGLCLRVHELCFSCFGSICVKDLSLTGQQHSGSDSADVLGTERQSRCSRLQLQAQTELVTAGVDILAIHQSRQEQLHTGPQGQRVSDSDQAGIIDFG